MNLYRLLYIFIRIISLKIGFLPTSSYFGIQAPFLSISSVNISLWILGLKDLLRGAKYSFFSIIVSSSIIIDLALPFWLDLAHFDLSRMTPFSLGSLFITLYGSFLKILWMSLILNSFGGICSSKFVNFTPSNIVVSSLETLLHISFPFTPLGALSSPFGSLSRTFASPFHLRSYLPY